MPWIQNYGFASPYSSVGKVLIATIEHSFLKWGNPDLFLFIFVIFKYNFTEKTVGFSRIRTWIVGVEGEHADPLTTTTALKNTELLQKNEPKIVWEIVKRNNFLSKPSEVADWTSSQPKPRAPSWRCWGCWSFRRACAGLKAAHQARFRSASRQHGSR